MTDHVQNGMLPSELLCPNCQKKGVVSSDSWQCKSCDQQYGFAIYCDTCNEPVQRLTGCGSSEHFYCRSCKTPKSRKAVLYTMTDPDR
ncbi:zinc-ribbon domain-containing protein [Dasania marina]|uniref:YfgJ family double zinc ribbon protein n=1 Tax=Dasania marina TaxID=471499 RepID=UPI0030D97CED